MENQGAKANLEPNRLWVGEPMCVAWVVFHG